MKKVKEKTEKIYVAYKILGAAKYGKMEDEDKIKLFHIVRALKSIATKFDEDNEDAAKKFKEDIKDFDERLAKAQEYERLLAAKEDTSSSKMSEKQYNAFIVEFKAYNKLVKKAIEEYAEKEAEVEFEPISEEAFGKLMSSNDWSYNQVVEISELIIN